MSTFEINKIVGAILLALLLAFGFSNLVRLTVGDEQDEKEPVFLVEVEAEADDEGAAATEAEAAEAATAMAEESGEAAAEVAEAVSVLVAAIAEAELAAGEKVFKKCAACHTVKQGDKHRIGPNLWQIVGAPRARHEDFKYSGAFRDLGGAWDYAALDAFLTNPKDYAPGTKMALPGIKDAAQRAAVIAYLRTLSVAPAPLAD